jgi:hypothetical protein
MVAVSSEREVQCALRPRVEDDAQVDQEISIMQRILADTRNALRRRDKIVQQLRIFTEKGWQVIFLRPPVDSEIREIERQLQDDLSMVRSPDGWATNLPNCGDEVWGADRGPIAPVDARVAKTSVADYGADARPEPGRPPRAPPGSG